MSKNTQILPSFFKDKSDEKGKGREIFLDYLLSWTLRCAVEPENKPITNATEKKVIERSKRILCYLLTDEPDDYPSNPSKKEGKRYLDLIDKINVTKVETWKQWSDIDLVVEIELTIDNKLEKHAILVEDKLYTHLKPHQLGKYKEAFDSEYKDKGYNLHYYVFTESTDCEADIALCKEYEFGFYDFSSIKDGAGISETGNYLFDEFWFRY